MSPIIGLQHVVDFMGDATGEAAKGIEHLELPDLLFRNDPFRNLRVGSNHTDRLVIVVVYDRSAAGKPLDRTVAMDHPMVGDELRQFPGDVPLGLTHEILRILGHEHGVAIRPHCTGTFTCRQVPTVLSGSVKRAFRRTLNSIPTNRRARLHLHDETDFRLLRVAASCPSAGFVI